MTPRKCALPNRSRQVEGQADVGEIEEKRYGMHDWSTTSYACCQNTFYLQVPH
jgi:hypothetical protein